MEKEKILVLGVEVEFNDLLESTQKKLYLQDKEKFEGYAAKSQFAKVRKLVIEDSQASSTNLDEIFAVETANYENITNLILLWNHPNFKKNDEKRRILVKGSFDARRMLAEDKDSSSKFLNEMLQEELQGNEMFSIIEEIMNNKKFKMEDKTREMLAKAGHYPSKVLLAHYKGNSSKFLNEILRTEMQNKNNREVIETIMSHENFKMEKETLEEMAINEANWVREIAAKDKESSSELLNKMLRREIQLDNRIDSIMIAIIENENFEIEDDTLEMLYRLGYEKYRKALARNASYELLKKMYAKEKEEKVLTVIEINLGLKLAKQYSLHN